MGVELAVGYLVAWAVRKARRVAGRVDGEVDQVLDAGMDRLHQIVVTRMGADPVLERLAVEAEAGRTESTDRTRMRLQLALEEETERDPVFAKSLEEAVAKVQAAAAAAGPGSRAMYGNTFNFNGPTALQKGDHNTQTNTFGA